MNLKIESKVTRILSPDLVNQLVLNSLIKGSDTSASFKVEKVDQKDFLVTPSNASGVSITLSNIITLSKLVFIHAQCTKLVTNPLMTPDPVKFQTSIGGVAIAKMAQFQMTDLKDFTAEILFNSFDINPTVTITGDGTGATATATVVDGVVTAINITAGGSGYTTATITINNGNGVGATATANITSGVVTAASVVDGGSDYSPQAILSILIGSIS